MFVSFCWIPSSLLAAHCIISTGLESVQMRYSSNHYCFSANTFLRGMRESAHAAEWAFPFEETSCFCRFKSPFSLLRIRTCFIACGVPQPILIEMPPCLQAPAFVLYLIEYLIMFFLWPPFFSSLFLPFVFRPQFILLFFFSLQFSCGWETAAMCCQLINFCPLLFFVCFDLHVLRFCLYITRIKKPTPSTLLRYVLPASWKG